MLLLHSGSMELQRGESVFKPARTPRRTTLREVTWSFVEDRTAGVLEKQYTKKGLQP
jgi:hypothetical protein